MFRMRLVKWVIHSEVLWVKIGIFVVIAVYPEYYKARYKKKKFKYATWQYWYYSRETRDLKMIHNYFSPFYKKPHVRIGGGVIWPKIFKSIFFLTGTNKVSFVHKWNNLFDIEETMYSQDREKELILKKINPKLRVKKFVNFPQLQALYLTNFKFLIAVRQLLRTNLSANNISFKTKFFFNIYLINLMFNKLSAPKYIYTVKRLISKFNDVSDNPRIFRRPKNRFMQLRVPFTFINKIRGTQKLRNFQGKLFPEFTYSAKQFYRRKRRTATELEFYLSRTNNNYVRYVKNLNVFKKKKIFKNLFWNTLFISGFYAPQSYKKIIRKRIMAFFMDFMIEKARISWEIFHKELDASEYDLIKTPERNRLFNYTVKKILFKKNKLLFKKLRIFRFFRKSFFFRLFLVAKNLLLLKTKEEISLNDVSTNFKKFLASLFLKASNFKISKSLQNGGVYFRNVKRFTFKNYFTDTGYGVESLWDRYRRRFFFNYDFSFNKFFKHINKLTFLKKKHYLSLYIRLIMENSSIGSINQNGDDEVDILMDEENEELTELSKALETLTKYLDKERYKLMTRDEILLEVKYVYNKILIFHYNFKKKKLLNYLKKNWAFLLQLYFFKLKLQYSLSISMVRLTYFAMYSRVQGLYLLKLALAFASFKYKYNLFRNFLVTGRDWNFRQSGVEMYDPLKNRFSRHSSMPVTNFRIFKFNCLQFYFWKAILAVYKSYKNIKKKKLKILNRKRNHNLNQFKIFSTRLVGWKNHITKKLLWFLFKKNFLYQKFRRKPGLRRVSTFNRRLYYFFRLYSGAVVSLRTKHTSQYRNLHRNLKPFEYFYKVPRIDDWEKRFNMSLARITLSNRFYKFKRFIKKIKIKKKIKNFKRKRQLLFLKQQKKLNKFKRQWHKPTKLPFWMKYRRRYFNKKTNKWSFKKIKDYTLKIKQIRKFIFRFNGYTSKTYYRPQRKNIGALLQLRMLPYSIRNLKNFTKHLQIRILKKKLKILFYIFIAYIFNQLKKLYGFYFLNLKRLIINFFKKRKHNLVRTQILIKLNFFLLIHWLKIIFYFIEIFNRFLNLDNFNFFNGLFTIKKNLLEFSSKLRLINGRITVLLLSNQKCVKFKYQVSKNLNLLNLLKKKKNIKSEFYWFNEMISPIIFKVFGYKNFKHWKLKLLRNRNLKLFKNFQLVSTLYKFYFSKYTKKLLQKSILALCYKQNNHRTILNLKKKIIHVSFFTMPYTVTRDIKYLKSKGQKKTYIFYSNHLLKLRETFESFFKKFRIKKRNKKFKLLIRPRFEVPRKKSIWLKKKRLKKKNRKISYKALLKKNHWRFKKLIIYKLKKSLANRNALREALRRSMVRYASTLIRNNIYFASGKKNFKEMRTHIGIIWHNVVFNLDKFLYNHLKIPFIKKKFYSKPKPLVAKYKKLAYNSIISENSKSIRSFDKVNHIFFNNRILNKVPRRWSSVWKLIKHQLISRIMWTRRKKKRLFFWRIVTIRKGVRGRRLFYKFPLKHRKFSPFTRRKFPRGLYLQTFYKLINKHGAYLNNFYVNSIMSYKKRKSIKYRVEEADNFAEDLLSFLKKQNKIFLKKQIYIIYSKLVQIARGSRSFSIKLPEIKNFKKYHLKILFNKFKLLFIQILIENLKLYDAKFIYFFVKIYYNIYIKKKYNLQSNLALNKFKLVTAGFKALSIKKETIKEGHFFEVLKILFKMKSTDYYNHIRIFFPNLFLEFGSLLKYRLYFFFRLLLRKTKNTKKIIFIESFFDKYKNLKKIQIFRYLNLQVINQPRSTVFNEVLLEDHNWDFDELFYYILSCEFIKKIYRKKNFLIRSSNSYSLRQWLKNKKFLLWLELELEKYLKLNLKLTLVSPQRAWMAVFRPRIRPFFVLSKVIKRYSAMGGWRQQIIYNEVVWSFFIATKYYSSSYLADIIGEQIVKREKHWPFIKRIRFILVDLLIPFYKMYPRHIDGFRISINGKINGRNRAIRYLFYKYYKKDQISKIHWIDTKVDYSLVGADSWYGSFGIRVWISRA